MIKVCHITSSHNSTDTRIFHKECVSLANAGYETYLVAQGASREDQGVYVIGIGEAPKNRIQRMTQFASKIYESALSLDCDIYHFHDPELLPYGLKLKKKGKKVIFDSHENTAVQISEKDYIPHFLRGIFTRAYKLRETKIVRQLDAVIVPCTFDGKNIFEGCAKRTVFVANYPKKESFSSQYDLLVNKEYDICYVGGLTYERGIYHLIKAAGKGNLKLLLVGKFVSKEFENQVRALPEFANTTYLGVIPNTEVAKVMQKCIAGANTLLDAGQYYHFDTFGVKVPEYMSVGLPVIMNDSPYARKMVEKYQFGICVKPDEPEEIANAVIYLKSHPEEARQMGLYGRKVIEEEFNWGVEEKKLLAVYSDI